MASYVKAVVSRQEYWIHEPDPDDRWDTGESDATIYIKGIAVKSEKEYRDITVNFDIDPARSYYLLWAKYGTGDSFGSHGGCVELIDLFINEELAIAAKKKFSNREDYTPVKYIREGLVEVQYSPPWDAYFEWLQELEIIEVRVVADE